MALKNTFYGVWLISIIGGLSVLPYAYYLNLIPASTSFAHVLLASIANTAIMYGVLLFFSYLLLQRVGIKPFAQSFFQQVNGLSIMSGVTVGLILVGLNKFFFKSSALAQSAIIPPLWTRVMASLYGAINEEVLCRLFLLTLMYFVLNKCFAKREPLIMWGAITLSALFFGIAHLPAAFKIISPSLFEVSRILLLNGIAGIAFGYLYCTRGFWSGVIAHFTADLVIHVFF